VADVGRKVLNMRMQLLPVFYTLMQAATETGAPLFRALFMNFPADPLTYANSRWDAVLSSSCC
jgi:alpha-glucosidase (family GH31 glycosyl hydrolase)